MSDFKHRRKVGELESSITIMKRQINVPGLKEACNSQTGSE